MICRFLFSPYTYVNSSLGCDGSDGQHHKNGIGPVANKENYCSRARYYSLRFLISTAFSLGVAKKKLPRSGLTVRAINGYNNNNNMRF